MQVRGSKKAHVLACNSCPFQHPFRPFSLPSSPKLLGRNGHLMATRSLLARLATMLLTSVRRAGRTPTASCTSRGILKRSVFQPRSSSLLHRDPHGHCGHPRGQVGHRVYVRRCRQDARAAAKASQCCTASTVSAYFAYPTVQRVLNGTVNKAYQAPNNTRYLPRSP